MELAFSENIFNALQINVFIMSSTAKIEKLFKIHQTIMHVGIKHNLNEGASQANCTYLDFHYSKVTFMLQNEIKVKQDFETFMQTEMEKIIAAQ